MINYLFNQITNENIMFFLAFLQLKVKIVLKFKKYKIVIKS